MSVTIIDYISNHSNTLTKILCSPDLKAVFLGNTLMTFRQVEKDKWCDIYLDYTISCNDLAAIAAAFDGYWWSFSPCLRHYTFCLSIDLEQEEL